MYGGHAQKNRPKKLGMPPIYRSNAALNLPNSARGNLKILIGLFQRAIFGTKFNPVFISFQSNYSLCKNNVNLIFKEDENFFHKRRGRVDKMNI